MNLAILLLLSFACDAPFRFLFNIQHYRTCNTDPGMLNIEQNVQECDASEA